MHLSVIPVINTIFSIFSGNPVDFTCPKSLITSETPKGLFPNGGLAQFPANYDCGFEFTIPSGYVVKFKLQTSIDEPGDKIVVRDSLSSLHEFTSASSIIYVPAEQAKLWIKTESSSSSFHFTWEYIDVTKFEEVQKSTEVVMSLNLTSNHYYRFKSENDRYNTLNELQLHTGFLSGGIDSSLSKIFVYDGDNLKSKFVGTLDQFTSGTNRSRSTGRSLTLVNYYRLPSDSYVIATDIYRNSQEENYELVILSKDKTYRSKKSSLSDFSTTIFHCVDSDETYITDLKYQQGGHITQGDITFSPSAPSSHVVVKYNQWDNRHYSYGRTFELQNLPQQILTNTFTMRYLAAFEIELRSGPLENYSQVVPGRSGLIVSPSRWNPTGSNSKTFYTNFTATESVKFVINSDYVHLEKPEDKLLVEVGTGHYWEAPQYFAFNGRNSYTKEVVGTSMAITFIGTSEKSNFALRYRVEATSGTYSYESATMSSSVSFGFSVFALLTAILI